MVNPKSEDIAFREASEIFKRLYKNSSLSEGISSEDGWEIKLREGARRMATSDGTLDEKIVRNFRRTFIFHSDQAPASDVADFEAHRIMKSVLRDPMGAFLDLGKEIFSGRRRAARHLLKMCVNDIERLGGAGFIDRYPISGTPGNPYYIQSGQRSYNLRWLRHLHFSSLLDRTIGDKIREKENFRIIDVGCGYGAFSSIIKKEYKNTVHTLVDLKEVLVVCYFFLKSIFPDSNFLLLLEEDDKVNLSEKMFSEYDFILVSADCYGFLSDYMFDMFCNFVSLGEMSNEVFDNYINSSPYNNSKYLFTCNRFISSPRYAERAAQHSGKTTVIDYKLHERRQLYMDICPVFLYMPDSYLGVVSRLKTYTTHFFDYIGEI